MRTKLERSLWIEEHGRPTILHCRHCGVATTGPSTNKTSSKVPQPPSIVAPGWAARLSLGGGSSLVLERGCGGKGCPVSSGRLLRQRSPSSSLSSDGSSSATDAADGQCSAGQFPVCMCVYVCTAVLHTAHLMSQAWSSGWCHVQTCSTSRPRKRWLMPLSWYQIETLAPGLVFEH